jgi:tetratricopeptide (TPR) repeat protein
VQRARGNLDAALKAYEDGLAIHEKLAAQDPSNAEWQRGLIVSNVKLAEVAESQGDLASEAKRHYQAAYDIAKALADTNRLAPADAWMVDELETLLQQVTMRAAQ